ncbi:MAG TPA: hypothetical protein VJK49_03785, partial [Candidatus Limnocylindrales bacterium]|nr:hypothetical protein [Candidatus Limnocylindrales bacterium]
MVLVLGIMYVVPLPIYGTLYALTGLEIPTTGSPAQFMMSVLVMKLGVAVAFVLLFALARNGWAGRQGTYAMVWWTMFALIEAGQAMTPDYSWLAAFGGMISEAIYFPASA